MSPATSTERTDVGLPAASGVRISPGHRAGVLIAVAPVVAFFVYGVEPFFLQNGIDPYIYAGYVFDAPDLIARYGYTYYSVRFGLLLPAQICDALFGSVAGYFILRWALVAFSLWALRRWCIRIGAPRLVVVASALFLVNPIVIRSVMTVYSDSVGVPFLLGAYVFLLVPGTRRDRLLSAFASGVLIGLAVNANLFVAVPVGASLIVWAIVRLVVFRMEAIYECLAVVGGIVLCTAAGSLIYWIRFGDPNVLRPSIDAARSLQGIVSAERAPNRQWLNFRPYLFLPAVAVFTLCLALYVRRTRPSWYEVCVVGMMAAVGAVYVYQEFIAEGFLLETYFYTSYFVGLTVLVMTLAIRRLLADAGERLIVIGALAGSIVLLPFVWLMIRGYLQVWTIWALPIALCSIGLCVFMQHSTHAQMIAGCLLSVSPLLATLSAPANVALAPGQPFRREPRYDSAMFHPDYRYLDVYAVANKFMNLVPNSDASPGTVVFWYRVHDEVGNLVGSTFLWLRTTLTVTDPGMPQIDESSASHLRNRTPRFFFVVASTLADLDAGVDVVRSVVEPLVVERSALSSGSVSIHVARMEFVPDACDQDAAGRETYWFTLPACS